MKKQELLNYLYDDQEIVNEPYFTTITRALVGVYDTLEKQEVIELIRFKNSFLLGGLITERELPFSSPWFKEDYEISSSHKDLYCKTWEKIWKSINKLESEIERYNNIFNKIEEEEEELKGILKDLELVKKLIDEQDPFKNEEYEKNKVLKTTFKVGTKKVKCVFGYSDKDDGYDFHFYDNENRELWFTWLNTRLKDDVLYALSLDFNKCKRAIEDSEEDKDTIKKIYKRFRKEAKYILDLKNCAHRKTARCLLLSGAGLYNIHN